jgi:hypothetical protein
MSVPPKAFSLAVPDAAVADLPRGGHFAATEQPALLAGEIQEFFRTRC